MAPPRLRSLHLVLQISIVQLEKQWEPPMQATNIILNFLVTILKMWKRSMWVASPQDDPWWVMPLHSPFHQWISVGPVQPVEYSKCDDVWLRQMGHSKQCSFSLGLLHHFFCSKSAIMTQSHSRSPWRCPQSTGRIKLAAIWVNHFRKDTLALVSLADNLTAAAWKNASENCPVKVFPRS